MLSFEGQKAQPVPFAAFGSAASPFFRAGSQSFSGFAVPKLSQVAEPQRSATVPPRPKKRVLLKLARNEVHSKYKSLLGKIGQPLKHPDQASLRREISKITPNESKVMGPEQKSRLAMWFTAYDPGRVAELAGTPDLTEITWDAHGDDKGNTKEVQLNQTDKEGAPAPSPWREYMPAKLQVISNQLIAMKLPDDINLPRIWIMTSLMNCGGWSSICTTSTSRITKSCMFMRNS